MSERSHTFSIVAGQDLISRALDFRAYGVMISNPTNQWYYEPSLQRFIPPYQTGITLPLTGTMVATLLVQAPVGNVQPVAIAGQNVSAVWVSGEVPFSLGSPIANANNAWGLNAQEQSGAVSLVKAAMPGIRHTCVSVMVMIRNSDGVVQASSVEANLFDGAAVLWTVALQIPAVAYAVDRVALPLNVSGTPGNKLELDIGAPAAHTLSTASLTGVDGIA